MGDQICTFCRGQYAAGCEYCNDGVPNAAPIVPVNCASCEERKRSQARVAGLQEELEKWDDLRQTIAELNGQDTDWPDHGNAPLAIAAGYLLEKNDAIRLKKWVGDLQSGMYINCVYCGHRYGPDDEAPAAMADVLKEHIKHCPEHPLSAAEAELDRYRAFVDDVLSVVRYVESGDINNRKINIKQVRTLLKKHGLDK